MLIGIPSADAVLELPALPIPRLERRVLGSIYGSSRPARDFPALLELYRRGLLPLDRLITRRVGLDDIETAFEAMHGGNAAARRARPGGGVMEDPLDGADRRGVVGRGARTAATSTWCWRGAARRRPRPPRARSRRPRPGHLPFLACLAPGVVVRPTTIVVNKSPIEGDAKRRADHLGRRAARHRAGRARRGGRGADRRRARRRTWSLLVAVWVDPAAHDETAVKAANRAAMRAAIADALRPPSADDVRALAARREEAANAYYTGRRG